MVAAVPHYDYPCALCGKLVLLSLARRRSKKNVFCSKPCKHEWDRQNRRVPLSEKIWDKVQFADYDQCWPWKGARNPNGYPIIHLGGKGSSTTLAARVAYKAFIGPIPDGMQVCHTCDNPPCMNPLHWFLGTPQDNSDDMVSKGRSADNRGERNPHARLSADDVETIRYAVARRAPVRLLASIYGVTMPMIYHIKTGRFWKELVRS